jgi:transcriptional repressor NrdR
MQCTSCKYPDSHVVYTRSDDLKKHIERRRECLRCGVRYTTHETLRDNAAGPQTRARGGRS